MKEFGPLVSVIVPVYETEEYLPACIDSICKQTYQNLEIILVDDQSPDKCPQICDDYAKKDSRIIVVHQENKGVSGARNTGMRLATGDYLLFVDSDDELYLEAIEILLRDANNYDADVISAVKQSVNKRGDCKSCNDGTINIYTNDEPLLLSLEGDRNTDSACAKLFKSSFVSDVFFEEGKNIHEDGFFLFCCYLKKPVLVQHNVVVYQYNFREGSGSRQLFSDKYLSMLYFCNKKKEMVMPRYLQYADQINNMEVRTNLQLLDVMCRTKEKKYKKLEKQCVNTVRRLYKYHKPINGHHKMLVWFVVYGLYPIYKLAVRLKYYR